MNESQSKPSSTSLQPPPRQIPSANYNRCGACYFHEAETNICFGVGPTPILLGVQQPAIAMKGAQPTFRFESIRPFVRPTERACAHYKTDPAKFAAMVAAQEEENARLAKAS
jgi:hypothetical protein